MKKVYLVLAVLVALALVANPAMAYVSVKYIPDFTPVRSGDLVTAPPPGGWVDVNIYQTSMVRWWVNLQRLPSGPVTMWPGPEVATGQGVWTTRQPNRVFELWTEYQPPMYYGYKTEDTTFTTIPGYDVYVTIVPEILKFEYIPVPG